MKLISILDFVLQVVTSDRPCDRGKMLDEIGNYAEFLKQPLTLGMFVPCDEEGNVLIEPIYTITNYGILEDGLLRFQEDKRKYQQAKEKVLFEGFEKHDLKTLLFKYRSIESLQCVFNNIKLTESAIKQIEL